MVEFSYAPTGYTPDEPQGRVLMQADAGKLEVYGVTPDEVNVGVKLWLARGYGFIKTEHTKSSTIVGGDLVNE